jgi:arylsulfatase A-like enzyme
VGPGVPAGHRVAENVSLIDLGPTLFALVGLPPEPRFEGRSLSALWGDDGVPDAGAGRVRDLLLQLPRRDDRDQRAHARALVRGHRKLLIGRTDAVELYDLGADPGETRSDGAAHSRDMIDALARQETDLGERAAPHRPAEQIDDPLAERLRALGYLR